MESTTAPHKSEKRSKKEKRDKKDKKDKKEKRRSRDAEHQARTTDSEKKGKKRSRSEEPKDKKEGKKARRESKTKEVVKEEQVTKAQEKPLSTPEKKTTKSPKQEEEMKKYLETHNITIFDADDTSFVPIQKFADTGFPQDILAVTKKFTTPTPIQALSWPILSLGRDLIGIAETGSGKTLAFGLPGIVHIRSAKNEGDTPRPKLKHPRMLVVAPTRELAQQSHDVLQEAGKLCKPQIFTTAVYGGVAKGPQISAFSKQMADIIVACPGRLLDLARDGRVDLSKVDYVVLDEADRLLDMGFEPDIRAIFGMVSKQRQTLMFSATWPRAVQQLASDFLNKPMRVVIGSEELSANSRVEQIVEVIDMEHRRRRLLELLKEYHRNGAKTLVFVLYKKEASEIEFFLQKNGHKCGSIHGDKSSAQRAAALEAFKKGTFPLLVATDVAARGLDIPKVEYVINFSFPLTIEDYVHRIGRTGRAGATGISHTFFHKHDKSLSGELISLLRQSNVPVPEALMAFGSATKKKEPKLGKIDTNFTSNRITFDSSSEENDD